MAFTLTDGRLLVRQFAKSGGDTTLFPDAEVDRGIQAAFDDFLHATRLARTTTALAALTPGAADATYAVAGFLPFRLFRAYLAGFPDLSVVPQDELAGRQRCDPRTGRPCLLAFTAAGFSVYPTPDAAATYTPTFEWAQPLSFTAGTGAPGGVDLTLGGSVPEDVVRNLLMYGGVAFLQQSYPEFKFARDSYDKYVKFRDRMAGNVATGKSFTKRGAW
jgi:hypothetical protein